jgi:hypothetical protein
MSAIALLGWTVPFRPGLAVPGQKSPVLPRGCPEMSRLDKNVAFRQLLYVAR